MKPQSAKAKGRELQKFLAELIVLSFKGLESDDVVSRPMGSSGIDLLMSPEAQRVFPISIESKNTKTKPGPSALEQAKYNVYPGTFPAVVWKPPRKSMIDSLVTMRFEDLIELVKKVRDEDLQ